MGPSPTSISGTSLQKAVLALMFNLSKELSYLEPQMAWVFFPEVSSCRIFKNQCRKKNDTFPEKWDHGDLVSDPYSAMDLPD